MSWFDYTCTWCNKKFSGKDVVSVTSLDDIDENIFSLMRFSVPKKSIRKFSRFLCRECAKNYEETLQMINYAYRNKFKVELVSINYHGLKNDINRYNWNLKCVTWWYRDKNEAENILRTFAFINGCQRVINVYWERETEEEDSENGKGTHYYSVFRYIGTLVKDIDKNK